jgi:hypothetical protein
MAYVYEKTGDPTYAAYCQFVFEWHRNRLQQDGFSDSVLRKSLGMPDFGFGFVSGYLAAGLAVVAQARARGVDLEAAMQKLREERARAAGHDPKMTDDLFYSVPYSAQIPFRWYRNGRVEEVAP